MKNISNNDNFDLKYYKRYLDKSRTISLKYLQKLSIFPNEPKELEYFKNIIKKVFIDNEIIKYDDNEKFIGSFCEMVPSEIIYAAGARPIKLCGNNYVSYLIGDYSTPRDVCPLSKAIVGNVVNKVSKIHDACDMYVVPITCDCKKNIVSQISEYKDTIPLYVPFNCTDDNGMETYVKEIKNLVKNISNITKKEVTRESLGKQIKIHSDVQKEIERFIKLRGNSEILIRGIHSIIVMNSLAYDDISNWGKHLKKLNDELSIKKNNKDYLTNKRLPRILVTGTPFAFPNIKIPMIIEEQGGLIVCNETCFEDANKTNYVAICDDTIDGYYKALANAYIKPCCCPIFSNNDKRIRKLEKLVNDYQIDGIIYNTTKGCVIFDYEYEKINNYFNEIGIPSIRIESDYSEEDVEQLRIRIEAFVEMLKYKKRKVKEK